MDIQSQEFRYYRTNEVPTYGTNEAHLVACIRHVQPNDYEYIAVGWRLFGSILDEFSRIRIEVARETS